MAETYAFRSAVNGFHRGDVITYLQKLLNENAALKEQAAALRETAEARKTEIDALKRQLDEAEKKNAGGERVDTALLGAAMYDARRFSDLIVGEANAKAGEVFNQTAAFAQQAGEKTNELSAAVSALAKKVRDTLAEVENGMVALGVDLETFRSGVTDDKDAFLKAFSDETAEKFEREKNAPKQGTDNA